MEYKEKVRKQITDAAGKVVYTYTAHWKMADRLRCWYMVIKIIQIALTAISTVGFLSSILAEFSAFGWIGGLTAAISLALNLYTLNFNLPEEIRRHIDAANELWSVRESYVSLLTDFDILTDDDIRKRRDKLIAAVSHINNSYPGTDKRSYYEAKKALTIEEEQYFSEGEAEKLLSIDAWRRGEDA